MKDESQRGNAKVIDAEVPLSEMFGYVTDLRFHPRSWYIYDDF